MADVWVKQNPDKSIVGVFGSRSAANRGEGDEDARAIPFDIIEPKASAASVVTPDPIQIEVPVFVNVPSDDADGKPLLDALNEIQRVLTSANAPKQILEAISKISDPAIEAYNASAGQPIASVPELAPTDLNEPTTEEAPAEQPPAEQPPAEEAAEVSADDALGFLMGDDEEDQNSSVEDEVAAPQVQPELVPSVEESPLNPAANSEPAVEPVVAESGSEATPVAQDTVAPVEFIAPKLEADTDYIPLANLDNEDMYHEESAPADVPPPVSAFGRSGDTGLGSIVSPLTDPSEIPALNDSVIGLASWLVPAATPSTETEAPLTRRELRAREEAAAGQAGDSTPEVVI